MPALYHSQALLTGIAGLCVLFQPLLVGAQSAIGTLPDQALQPIQQDIESKIQELEGVACALTGSFCPPSAPTPPTSGAAAPGTAPDNEDGDFYFLLPRTTLTNPGQQTRTNYMEMFPAQFFTSPAAPVETLPTSFLSGTQGAPGAYGPSVAGAYGPSVAGAYGSIFGAGNTSGAYSALSSFVAAPPVANGSNGGWTMYSTDSGVIVIHLTPLSNGQLFFMERPGGRESPPQIAAFYNLNNNTYQYTPMTDSPFCSGHIQLINDRPLVVGGDNIGLDEVFVDGRYNIRVFTTGANPSYEIVAKMQPYFPPSIDPNSGARWYPTLLTMIDGNVLLIGGETLEGGGYGPQTSVNPTYQFFQVNNNTITQNQYIALIQNTNPINLYPYATVISGSGNGLVLMISGQQTRFYRYTPGLLTNDTTTFPAVPNLPIPVMYPQTASIVLLPLELPNYTQRILVVGGTSTDLAYGGTPATANTYLLDLSVRPLQWRLETMSQARVMPDTVLLPDGTLFICNGADTGTAGGTPGNGNAANVNGFGARAGEIYVPSNANGTRFGGLLANSGRDRLYHSVAILTANAEVLVTGSEVTEDYTMQIFTPPYLTGTFVRPMIQSVSTQNAAYGATITATLRFVGGTAVTISRVVVNRVGGVTHSNHFDQRQVACAFTTTGATTLSITMPPNATIAPPGQYQLFIVSSTGRPSMAYNLGLGGATVTPPFYQPNAAPVLANGFYTITSATRAGCNAYLNSPSCSVDNTVVMDTQGVWQLTYLPHAPQANTFNVVNYARLGSCNSYLGTELCSNGNDLYAYSGDDTSGRQQWTFMPVAGGYTIQVLVGRENCSPSATYLTTVACGASSNVNVLMMMGNTSSIAYRTWSLTAVAQPPLTPQAPFVPAFANGTHFLTNNGRATCANALNTSTCAGGNGVLMAATAAPFVFTQLPTAVRTNTYELTAIDRACNQFLSTGGCPSNYIDLFNVDDGSGRQQVAFEATTGGYNMIIYNGRPCNQYISAQSCSSGATDLTLTGTDDGSGLQVWTVSTSSVAPYFANGYYQISNSARSACNNVLGGVGCAAGNTVDMEPGGSWEFVYLPNAPNPNTYQLINLARNGTCNQYLSSASCNANPANLVDLYYEDDASGRQEFTFTRVGSNTYTISLLTGRAGCNDTITTQSCAAGSFVGFAAGNDGSGLQLWSVTPVNPAPPPARQLLPNGQYQLSVTGRSACDAYLNGDSCASGNGIFLTPTPGIFQLTYVVGALNPNTYDITSVPRTGSCYNYLSSGSCPNNYADLYHEDDGSGRQQWTIAPAGSGYTITVLNGRNGCETYFGGNTCANGDAPLFYNSNDGSGLQVWSITAPGPPSPPTGPQLFPNGQYQLVDAGRSACASNLAAATCTQGNTVALGSGNGLWTFTYLPSAPFINTYTVQATSRIGSCYSFLSSSDCTNNVIDLFGTDDGSGRQEWTFTPAGSGYFIQVNMGRDGCATYLSSPACSSSGSVDTPLFVTANDSTGLQIWDVIAPASPAPPAQILPNGQFYIISSDRNAAGCNSYLSAAGNCLIGQSTTLAPGDDGSGLQVWQLSAAAMAGPNIYNFQISARSQCNNYLSAASCPTNVVDLFSMDDGSGRQEWQVASAGTGLYTITTPQGRNGCGQVLSAAACTSGNNSVSFADSATPSVLETWAFVPVNAAAG